MRLVTIDGKPRRAPEGATVLDVAREAGIDIPTFCHHRALGPVGACRLCIVEVEGPALARTILPACTLPASEGLVVETCTERLQRYRTTIVQLLVASLPASAGLARLAERFGVTAPPFTSDRPDACALCGLCVRACRERIGAGALSFQGDESRPRSVADRIVLDAAACVGCGTCAVLCPVGAIAVEDRGLERRIALYGATAARLELARCAACGEPHVTRQLRDLVLSRLDETMRGAVEDLCPACARVRRAGALGGALALQD